MLKERKFKPNQTIIKLLGVGESRQLKITTLRWLRTSGIEDDQPRVTGVNDSKLDDNIKRARDAIFELSICNPWDWFFTGTLDPKKYCRSDLQTYHKDFTQFLRDVGKRSGGKIDFLLIPELHHDGVSWHMHGFLRGVPVSALRQFRVGDTMGKYIADKVKAGKEVFTWPAYAAKFGYCDLEPIQSQEAASKYVTKYISKDLASCVKDVGAHLYYRSRGLKMGQVIAKGTMAATIAPDFQNEYCSISSRPYSKELLAQLLEGFDGPIITQGF